METADAEYVARARLGQKDAFGILVDRYRDVVFGICYSKCRDFGDSQDLAQEAFLKAYINLDALRDPSKFAPWLYRIACALCVDRFRESRLAMVPIEEWTATASLSSPVEDEVMRHASSRSVSEAMSRLPETQRLPATLHYLCGYTCEEIGRMTGATANSIKSRLTRARGQLRNHLQREFSGEYGYRKPGKSFRRKVLSGLVSFEKEETFSHMRALKALLEYHGERVDWCELLGVSGEAFCIYTNPDWIYLSRFVHSWDVLNAGCSPYGYTGVWRLNSQFDEALDVIEKRLADGFPVAAPGVNPCGGRGGTESHYWFVVTGMDRAKQELTLSGVGQQDSRVGFPWRGQQDHQVMGWMGVVRCLDVYPQFMAHNPLFYTEPGDSRPDPREVDIAALRRAVYLAGEPPLVHTEFGKPDLFYGGLQGLRVWGEALYRTLHKDFGEGCRDMPQQQVYDHYGAVIHSTSKRIDGGRRSAASYVHSLAESDYGLSASYLIEAANHYEASAGAAQRLLELFFDPQEEQEMLKAVSKYRKPLYYSREETVRFWQTFLDRFANEPERRREGVDIIDEITDHEQAAVRCLERTLRESGDACGDHRA